MNITLVENEEIPRGRAVAFKGNPGSDFSRWMKANGYDLIMKYRGVTAEDEITYDFRWCKDDHELTQEEVTECMRMWALKEPMLVVIDGLG